MNIKLKVDKKKTEKTKKKDKGENCAEKINDMLVKQLKLKYNGDKIKHMTVEELEKRHADIRLRIRSHRIVFSGLSFVLLFALPAAAVVIGGTGLLQENDLKSKEEEIKKVISLRKESSKNN